MYAIATRDANLVFTPSAMTAITPIILDCDPGHDDAIAIFLALGSPSIDLLAITTVAGNQTLEKVTRNALSIAAVAGIPNSIPIAAGCDRPLIRTSIVADGIHGTTGLDGPVLPEPTHPLDPRHAADVIIDTLRSRPGEVSLVAVGPLTNLALAIRKAPDIVDLAKEVVLMGGGIATGNWSPVAEFNIAVDPEAAQIVFSAGWKVTMVPLDITHQALATTEVLKRISDLKTGPSEFVYDVLDFFTQSYNKEQGFLAPPVHDPCAVAHLIDRTVVKSVPLLIDVETQGKITTGQTVVDRRVPPPEGCPTHAAVEIDVERFWGLVIDALERVGEGVDK